MYAAYCKRPLDFDLSVMAPIVLLPFFPILTIAGTAVIGGNLFFAQTRSGKNEKNGQEKAFYLISILKREESTLEGQEKHRVFGSCHG